MQTKPENSMLSRRIEQPSKPPRNRILHWAAFAASLVSLVILGAWAFGNWQAPDRTWVLVDLGLCVAFAFEFLTRSGFTQNRGRYTRTHIFDFVAMVPALALVNLDVPLEPVYVWFILFARTTRAVDRVLGDGFVQRTAVAIVDGIEEEITSRVFSRILDRIQLMMDRVHLTHTVADTLAQKKSLVLERVRAAHPRKGLGAELAHITGLDAALERAEERTYDAIIEVFKSPELDRAVQEVITSAISSMKDSIAVKEWREHFGIEQQKPPSSKKKP